jgi:hypothetical protein
MVNRIGSFRRDIRKTKFLPTLESLVRSVRSVLVERRDIKINFEEISWNAMWTDVTCDGVQWCVIRVPKVLFCNNAIRLDQNRPQYSVVKYHEK